MQVWVYKGIEFAGNCKKVCKAEGIQSYSTVVETKAAFAERTIRSLRNVFFSGYMEDYESNNFTNCLILSEL